jgi:uncharacterized membrane protein
MSEASRETELEERIAALERRVEELESRGALSTPPPLRRYWPALPPPLARLTGPASSEAESEDILGKVGIGLLLVGVLFLLKYTIDRDLLTPAVRITGAAAIGVVLLVVGQRLRERRRVLGRLLAGGGVAALFGSLWTASALYPLIPPAIGLAGMAAVAALSLGLAVRESDPALSVVGTVGALMTPLLLYRDPGQMGVLTAYVALVVGGAGWVYARHGWAGLVGAAAAGGWAVVLVAWLVGVRTDIAGVADRMALTAAVAMTWGVTGGLPAWRLWKDPGSREPTILRVEPVVIFVAPALAFAFIAAAWAWSTGVATVMALVLGGVYLEAARRLRARPAVFEPLVLAAAAMLAWAAARWFGVTDARSLGVAVALACGVVHLARREAITELRLVGHMAALALAAALLLEQYLAPGSPFGRLERLSAAGAGRETAGALVGAVALAAIGFTSVRGSTARYAYLTAAHLVIVLWARAMLLPLAGGPALTSTTWALYAVVLIAAGLRMRDDVLRQIGLGTVLVTVAKVLLVDLSSIPTLWRVLLFMGLGTLMLLVSYFVPALLRGRPVPDAVSEGGPDGMTGAG